MKVKKLVKKGIIGTLVVVPLLPMVALPSLACQDGSCTGLAASQQSNTTTNTASPTAISNTTANPTAIGSGTNYNSQMVFNPSGESKFEGVVTLPGGPSIKGAVQCGNNSVSLAAFPSSGLNNQWVFSGGIEVSLVKNAIDCRSQQEIVECAQLYSFGSSGEYYDSRCGKYGFRARTTAAIPAERPEVRPASELLMPSTTSAPAERPSSLLPRQRL